MYAYPRFGNVKFIFLCNFRMYESDNNYQSAIGKEKKNRKLGQLLDFIVF